MPQFDIRQLHTGKSLKEREEYLKSLKPYKNFNNTEEKPSIFDETDSSSSQYPDRSLDTAQIKRKSFWLIIVDFFKGNFGVTIVGGVIVSILSIAVIGYFTLLSEQKAQNAIISNLKTEQEDVSNMQANINDKISDLNTEFQVFKANITKDFEYIKNNIGINNK